MELTYQSPLMPAAYTAISADEMTYIDGGISLHIDPVDVALFGINFTVNFGRMMGSAALSAAIGGLIVMHKDGLSPTQSVSYFWDGQNTRGKVATVVVGGLAGWYAYTKVMQIYNTVKSIYTEFKNAYEMSKAQQAQNAAQQEIGITDPIVAAAA